MNINFTITPNIEKNHPPIRFLREYAWYCLKYDCIIIQTFDSEVTVGIGWSVDECEPSSEILLDNFRSLRLLPLGEI